MGVQVGLVARGHTLSFCLSLSTVRRFVNPVQSASQPPSSLSHPSNTYLYRNRLTLAVLLIPTGFTSRLGVTDYCFASARCPEPLVAPFLSSQSLTLGFLFALSRSNLCDLARHRTVLDIHVWPRSLNLAKASRLPCLRIH
ncbi:hypothetical protein LY76DRAFT_328735 [Colletotrichum caudatum]|nr:hypothetical protein LY76DRAFT_328735 [Colletotrichum caudatum]